MENVFRTQTDQFVNTDDPFIAFYFRVVYWHEQKALPEDFPETFPEENKRAFFAILESALSRVEWVVVIAHFGLAGKPCKPLSEISQDLMLPKKQVSRILKRAIRNLRKNFRRQLEVLLRTRSFYEQELENLHNRQTFLETEFYWSHSFQEFLRSVSCAKMLLARSETLNFTGEIVQSAELLAECETNLCILTNPTLPVHPIRYHPNNLIEVAKSSLDVLLKVAHWIEVDRDLTEAIFDNPSIISYQDSVNSLDLSTRTTNLLHRIGIFTIENLRNTTKKQLESTHGLGRKSVQKILEACHEIGIEIADK